MGNGEGVHVYLLKSKDMDSRVRHARFVFVELLLSIMPRGWPKWRLWSFIHYIPWWFLNFDVLRVILFLYIWPCYLYCCWDSKVRWHMWNWWKIEGHDKKNKQRSDVIWWWENDVTQSDMITGACTNMFLIGLDKLMSSKFVSVE